ncbi:hypothetical protein KVH31_13295 [Streptomyces olivaceus]|uniref:hypothetical protein n=1 Tax=Streptomyces olivaceus TaxID=47716 RepID=UPI001CCF759F|nr:hypothetical protein [Streptomyces olivaceus]MBZ6207473.1 hypothetical protein [Streptomyces olivaceus]
MNELTPEEIAELRKQGDFRDYLRHITGRTVEPEAPSKPALTAVPTAGYRITHTGGWPLGTAATGPTPPPDACTCACCGGNPNSTVHQPQEGNAA